MTLSASRRSWTPVAALAKAFIALGALGAVGFFGALLPACGSAPNSIDVRDYPPDMQTRYDLFEKRCTRCHELERPLNAQVGAGGWPKYVRRMARHPAAGIPAEEQREIALFLEYHAERRRDAQRQALEGGAP
jgi:hypothetical protein